MPVFGYNSFGVGGVLSLDTSKSFEGGGGGAVFGYKSFGGVGGALSLDTSKSFEGRGGGFCLWIQELWGGLSLDTSKSFERGGVCLGIQVRALEGVFLFWNTSKSWGWGGVLSLDTSKNLG